MPYLHFHLMSPGAGAGEGPDLGMYFLVLGRLVPPAFATGGRFGVGDGLRSRGFLGGEGRGEEDITTWDYSG